MAKDDIRKYLYETCKYPPEEDWYPGYPPEERKDIIQNAYSRLPPWMRNLEQVPAIPNGGKDVYIVVAGGEVIRGFGAAAIGDHGFDPVVTKPVALADGTPAKSVKDFKHHK